MGRLYPSLPQEAPRVVLVHSGDELLPQFDPDLRIEALRALERRGVTVRLGRRVQRVDEEALRLDDGSDVPCALCAWCAVRNTIAATRRHAGAPAGPVRRSLHRIAPGAGWGRRPTARRNGPAADRAERRRAPFMGLGDAIDCVPIYTEPVPQTTQVAGSRAPTSRVS